MTSAHEDERMVAGGAEVIPSRGTQRAAPQPIPFPVAGWGQHRGPPALVEPSGQVVGVGVGVGDVIPASCR